MALYEEPTRSLQGEQHENDPLGIFIPEYQAAQLSLEYSSISTKNISVFTANKRRPLRDSSSPNVNSGIQPTPLIDVSHGAAEDSQMKTLHSKCKDAPNI